MYHVTNPATGEVLKEFEACTDPQIDAAIAAAHESYSAWRRTGVAARAAVVAKAGEQLLYHRERLARIITTEMGKRISESRGEVDLAADIFAFYAENAETFTAPERLEIANGDAEIRKQSVGAIFGIMPWNYPYYQVARFAAPNLILGNTVLLKHAPNCPCSSAAVQEVLTQAGLPDGVYTNLYASHDQAARIIRDDRVQGVSLTGSERAGAAVATLAGGALKKVVLELGGSDPMVILDSSDVAVTARTAARARMSNTGQACNSPKRMIVSADIYDSFVRELATCMGDLEPGDPASESTELAPLSSVEARERLIGQIENAVRQGATLRIGGARIDGPGAYMQPTVLTGVTPGMDAHHEELFGPVAVVYRARDEAEAIALANDTPFGLGASVFSSDVERARRVADQLEVGMVSINAAGGSRPDLPFGGVKRSGVGRELGELGIQEFMNKKLVHRG